MDQREYTHNYLFVSDLHLSEGRHPKTGKISRNEDFFYDDAFATFLVHHLQLGLLPGARSHFNRPWKLIINGDLFDFLQVTSLPAEGDELEWVTGKRRYEDLRSNERKFGLGTSSKATVWKLSQILAGHTLFFQALGWFLARSPENQIIILKGNHDIELFWSPVQRHMRSLIAYAYNRWHQQVSGGFNLESPLPLISNLPETLDRQELNNRIQFPAWFHHEPGLFYAEHGNQYDPTNAFVNFVQPIMQPSPDDPYPNGEPLVALPSGSFFVRYFFNKVEQVHPFADNIKPLSRYLRWAVSKQPAATAQLLFIHRRELPSIWSNLNKKDASLEGVPELKESVEDEGMRQVTKAISMDAQLPLNKQTRAALHEMRQAHLQQAMETSEQVKHGTLSGLVLRLGMVGALLLAVRNFVERSYLSMGFDMALAGGGFFAGTWLSNKLDQIDKYVNLPEVGSKIARILNRPEMGEHDSVRYHIFGHDHHPNMVEITDDEHNPGYRQWYVNTGCWLSSFDEQARLTRGDVQLTFLRIIPPTLEEQAGESARQAVPELLEWLPRQRATRPILLFTPAEETLAGVGFQVAIEDLPEIAS